MSLEDIGGADAVDLGLQIVKLQLLKESEAGFDRNFAGSPLSLTFFLSLLASNSKGDIKDRLLASLGSKSSDELYEKSSNLLFLANSRQDSSKDAQGQGPLLLMNNGIWVDQRFSLKPTFKDVLDHVFKTEVRFLDFQNKSSEIADEVNSWVDKKTKGLIKDVISEEDRKYIWKRLFILINALYFKGAWELPFNKDLTKDDKFYLLDGKDDDHVQVPFMCQYSEYKFYNSFDDFKLIKLPYRFGEDDKRRFFMYIFLPHEKNGLRKLIHHFDSNPKFLSQKFKLPSQCVDKVKIPKFKFSCKFTASEHMNKVGFGTPLLCSLEMLENIDGEDRNIHETGAIHRSYIEVNEEGTEAAAVESDDDMGFSLEEYYRPKPNFVADHPFMFMVREDTSNIPFFIGAVINPLLEN